MRLKNVLLVVEDIEKSKEFYRNFFGLVVTAHFEGNVILSQGIVLQDKNIWNTLTNHEMVKGDADMELYFEEENMDSFLDKLYGVTFLNTVYENVYGQKIVRLYDPDGHLIEVCESINSAVKRLYSSGLTIEEIAYKTHLPIEQIEGVCGIYKEC